MTHRPRRLIRELTAAALFGLAGWAVCAGAMSIALWTATVPVAALTVHAGAVMPTYTLVSLAYFRRPRPLRPRTAGIIFGTMALVFDGALAIAFKRRFDAHGQVLGIWLPASFALLTTWITGLVMSVPSERAGRKSAATTGLPEEK